MKGTAISAKVRAAVLERDSIDGAPCCIICGAPHGIELAHFVSRGRGGKGIPENLVCLCSECHRSLDNGPHGRELVPVIEDYLKTHYPGWDVHHLVVKKGEQ